MKISTGSIVIRGKKYTYTIKEMNEISEEAKENCNRYVNKIMKGL